MATFTRMKDGTWGIRSTEVLTPGQEVVVTKQDGSHPTVRVECVVWSGNGVWLASIAKAAPKAKRAPKKVHAPFPPAINDDERYDDTLIAEARAMEYDETPF